MTARTPPLTVNAWLRYDAIMQALSSVRSGARFLEVGCGMGALGARLARRFRYTGLELDGTSAEQARARVEAAAPSARVLQAEQAALPEDERFEAVGAFEVLEHIEDDDGALRAWGSRLVPGGVLVLSVPAHAHRMGAWDHRVGHYRRYDPGQLTAQLGRAGLTDITESMYGFPIGYGLEAARNAVARRRGTEGASMAARTSVSGRSLQPTEVAGWVMAGLAWPFRQLQRPFRDSMLGTGLVVSARRPR